MNSPEFAAVVREVIAERTPREVAEVSGLHRATVYEMLRGNVPRKQATLESLIQGLGLDAPAARRLIDAAGYRHWPTAEFVAIAREIIGGVTNRQAAAATGLSHTTIGDILGGRIPTRDTLIRFADGLRATPGQRAALLHAAAYSEPRAGSEPTGEMLEQVASRAAAETAQRMLGQLEALLRSHRCCCHREGGEP